MSQMTGVPRRVQRGYCVMSEKIVNYGRRRKKDEIFFDRFLWRNQRDGVSYAISKG